MTCQIHLYDDEHAFGVDVNDFLEEREAENALFLGVLAGARREPPGGQGGRPAEEARQRMAGRIAEGNLFGWDAGGGLVAMAGLARPTAHTISVNAVYTPPAQRRRGFATALVAAVSAAGLARGKRAC